jgi:hypothetical protein
MKRQSNARSGNSSDPEAGNLRQRNGDTQDEISDISEKCLARAKKAGNGMQRSANKKAQAAISKTA